MKALLFLTLLGITLAWTQESDATAPFVSHLRNCCVLPGRDYVLGSGRNES